MAQAKANLEKKQAQVPAKRAEKGETAKISAEGSNSSLSEGVGPTTGPATSSAAAQTEGKWVAKKKPMPTPASDVATLELDTHEREAEKEPKRLWKAKEATAPER